MEDLTIITELLSLDVDHICSQALKSDKPALVEELINRNIFKFQEDVFIQKLDIFKLMIEKNFIEKEDITINHDINMDILKYIIEELKVIPKVKSWRNLFNNFDEHKEIINYLISKINNLEDLRKTGKGNNSLIFCLCSRTDIEKIKSILKLYPNNEAIREDLTSFPYIKEVKIIKFLIEEFKYPIEWISKVNTTLRVDDYLNSIMNKPFYSYLAVEFENKQDNISLPGIDEVQRYQKYYYGYKITEGLTNEQIQKYGVIMAGIGNAKVYNV